MPDFQKNKKKKGKGTKEVLPPVARPERDKREENPTESKTHQVRRGGTVRTAYARLQHSGAVLQVQWDEI